MASAAPERTIDIGRVVGGGFAALRAHFLVFFAFALVLVGLPTGFMQFWVWNGIQSVTVIDGAFVLGYVGAALGGLLLSLVGGMVLQGLVVRSTVLFLSGREPDTAQSVAVALRLILPIIAVSIVVGLMVMVGLLALIVPGIMIYCAFIVSVPALIEERGGVFASMRRSRELTRGSRGHIFLLAIMFWVISLVIGALFELIGGGADLQGLATQPSDPILYGAMTGLGGALTSVIVAVLLASLYLELRTVKEGTPADTLADIFG